MALVLKKRYFLSLLFLAFIIPLLVALYTKAPKLNGVLYVVNKGDKTITVLNLSNNKKIAEIPIVAEPHEITLLKFGDFQRLVVANYGNETEMGRSLTVIDPAVNKVSAIIDLGENVKPHGIVCIPNSFMVAVTGELGNVVMLVDIRIGKVVSKIKTNQLFSHLIAVHPNRSLLYVSNAGAGNISVLDWRKSKVVDSISCDVGMQGLAVSPNGNELWCLNSESSELVVYSLNQKNRIKLKIVTGKKPMRIKFSSDGKYALVTNALKGVLSVYDVKNKNLAKEVSFPGNGGVVDHFFHHTPRPAGVFSDVSGGYAFVSNSNAKHVELVNLKSFEHVYSYVVGNIPDGLVLISDR